MTLVQEIKTEIEADVEENLHVTEAAEEEEKTGIRGNISNLYTGLSTNLLKECPPSGLYLGVYKTVKAKLLPLTMVAASKGVAFLIWVRVLVLMLVLRVFCFETR
mmetsp:Transcript_27552/g.27938  ORF Transcript_27552/g.27938 Transcript_27552/m.27938 type:complete len:105 (-) Transcript_27552:99-413(-)|eukprot:CAMPEP_0171295310 /NCGR_PEP_ID=MMETSP0816-20121228/3898_1 /TAXON_ID=420281 /ORGANISM="Proboscia inermis, Strain CCAP1064/1" /LENGTH=104 /DNA_ID=CAMNT_0011767863 /DNA_START=744 /DNA_END=1058 /DNA_ORIENTATION=-